MEDEGMKLVEIFLSTLTALFIFWIPAIHLFSYSTTLPNIQGGFLFFWNELIHS